MSLEEEKDLKIGQLVITERDVYGFEEKWVFDPDYRNKTILHKDNILIPKHTVGIITEFINFWAVSAVLICWGGDFKGKKLIITLNKAILLEKFIEKLDE